MKLQVFVMTALLYGLQLNAQTNSLSFAETFSVYEEAADTVNIPVVLTRQNANPVSVNLSLVSDFGTATAGEDFVLISNNLQFSGASDTQFVRLYIINDTLAEKAEYFALYIENPTNADTDDAYASLYIRDNDYTAPAARNNINLKHLGSFSVPLSGASAEIVAFDSASQSLFVVNSLNTYLHILDFSDPEVLTETAAIDMSVYGGGINSTATMGGVIAVAVQASPKTAPGKLVFLETDGTFIHEVTVGSLPDMVTFTPDGNYVLVANEGEPNGDYSVDPEGSISVIDISNGVQNAAVTEVNFNAFDGQESLLRSQGIRIFGANNPTTSRDFEPEYITVSAHSDTAYITLQENNAIAVLDIENKMIVNLLPLHAVDHRVLENALDASDDHEEILIANWPVNGLFLPDAIDNFEINGQRYLITANEGDAREYDNLEEEVRIGSNNYNLDPAAFPRADLLKEKYNLGRLNAVNTLGDTDNDGDFDEIYVMGGRSFSIWNTAGDLVFNSGDQFEQIINADPVFRKLFNANNEEENTPKNRSDNKGAEPEGVAVGVINDTTYGFIALERVGGIMVYDLSNPQNPIFVQYINTRDTTAVGGDLGTEGLIFIPRTKNQLNKDFLVAANETSGTVSVFEIESAEATNGLNKTLFTQAGFTVYPNPIEQNMLYFSRTADGQLYDSYGRIVRSFRGANKLNMASLPAGTYFLKAEGFNAQKIILP